MGQKVNPEAFRLGAVTGYTWRSHWIASNRNYKDLLFQDIKLRAALMDKLKLAGVVRVDIDRSPREIRIRVIVSRPGMVIGRAGTGTDELKKYISELIKSQTKDKLIPKIDLMVEEVKDPEISAYLIANRISEQLAKRMPHRRVVKRTMEKVMVSGAKGIKVILGGRINGAEIARHESFHQGAIPLQTLRADIDYASVPSLTKSGYIGVKVWVYKGEIPTL